MVMGGVMMSVRKSNILSWVLNLDMADVAALAVIVFALLVTLYA